MMVGNLAGSKITTGAVSVKLGSLNVSSRCSDILTRRTDTSLGIGKIREDIHARRYIVENFVHNNLHPAHIPI